MASSALLSQPQSRSYNKSHYERLTIGLSIKRNQSDSAPECRKLERAMQRRNGAVLHDARDHGRRREQGSVVISNTKRYQVQHNRGEEGQFVPKIAIAFPTREHIMRSKPPSTSPPRYVGTLKQEDLIRTLTAIHSFEVRAFEKFGYERRQDRVRDCGPIRIFHVNRT